MKKYDVVVTYDTRWKTGLTRVFEAEAKSLKEAKQLTRDAFDSDQRRRYSTITKVAAVEVVPPIIHSPPAPVPQQNILYVEPDGVDKVRAGDKVKLNDGSEQLVRARLVNKTDIEYVVLEDSSGTPRLESLRGLKRRMEPRVKTTFHTIYPDGNTYQQDRPVRSSGYGVENLVQVKIVRRSDTGALVSSEIV